MSWYNPRSWGRKSELTLDALIQRLDSMRNTASGVSIDPTTAMTSPTVFAIVTRLSRAVASLPFGVFKDVSREDHRKVEPLDEHPVYKLLAVSPNRTQTPYEYWSLVMTRLLLWGRFYAWKRKRRDGTTFELIPLDNDKVTPIRLASGRVRYQVWLTDRGREVQRELSQDQVHVITALSVDGVEPVSPIVMAREAIALEIAAQTFGAQVFGAGAIPNVILKRKGHFKDQDAADRFKKSWNDAYKNRGTAVLEDDMDFQTVQMSNEESQFLESRKFQRSVIAGAFGIPPHMVGDLERATFSNIEHLSLDFVIHALRPHLTCIEKAVDRDLLTPEEREKKTYSRFNVNDLLRGDAKSRAEALQIMRTNGVINANEWRAIEHMNSREDEGGDDYITPLNFRVEDEDGTEPTEKDQVVLMRRIQ